MTESQWLNCTNPGSMLKFLSRKASDRKLRLFALACCNRIRRLITHPAAQDALAFAERYADQGVFRRKGRPAVERAARTAHQEAYNAMFASPPGVERDRCLVVSNAIHAAAQTLNPASGYAAHYASSFSCFAVAWEAQAESGVSTYPMLADSFKYPEWAQQAHLVRDIFGNPCRPLTILTTWRTPTVVALAQAVYEHRILPAGTLEPARLTILADALEEAGCDNADILNHCRQPGEHVRGCWLVDLLLEKT